VCTNFVKSSSCRFGSLIDSKALILLALNIRAFQTYGGALILLVLNIRAFQTHGRTLTFLVLNIKTDQKNGEAST